MPRLGAKTEAVLAYLALRGALPASRRSLIELLWSDRCDDDARNALRQWLFHFRKTCGQASLLRVDGELIAIDPSQCDVDLWRLEELGRSDNPIDWPQACSLFTGDLAEQLAATPEFDRWIAGQRELVRGTARELLVRMSQCARDPATVAAACAMAHLLITTDPLDEAAYRALMTLQDGAGQRAKALETWRQCRRALMAEVGAQPSVETTAVHERIQGVTQALSTPWQFPVLRLHCADTPPSPLPGSDKAMQAAADDVLRGLHHYFLGTPDDNALARAAYRSAAALAPHAAQPGVLAAFTCFNDFNYGWNGDPHVNFRRAAGMAAGLRRRYPRDPLPYGISGKLRLWAGEYEAAIEELEVALAGFESPWHVAALADAHTRVGNHGEALALVRRALDMEPNDHGVFRTIEGMAHYALGDLDAALQCFGSAVRRHPRYCVAWGGLAAVHAELGDLEAAREATAAATQDNLRQSVEFARNGLPMADPKLRARWESAWAAAGMPSTERRWQGADNAPGEDPLHVLDLK